MIKNLTEFSDTELKNLVRQVERMNVYGSTDEQLIRAILDEEEHMPLIAIPIAIYKEAALRWIKQ